MRPNRLLAWGLSSFLIASIGIMAQADDARAPEASRADLHAQRLLAVRCTMCHGMDLIAQQRLDAAHWSAIVKKMSSWGAQVSESEQETLVAYLVSHYHPNAGSAIGEEAVPRSLPSIETLRGHAARGRSIYEQNCLPCHGPQGAGGVGPKLAGNHVLTDTPRFWETVVKGRGGMPPWNTLLTGQEIADIHTWLRTLK